MEGRLFSRFERTDLTPRRSGVPSYTYWDHSARSAFSALRNIYEDWFERYPEVGRAEFLRRFRSKKDGDHLSAVFELFLHEFIFRAGFDVELHSELGNATKKRPDFLVRQGSIPRFYLEATLVTWESDSDRAANARLEKLYESLDSLSSPNFFLGIDIIEGSPENSISTRRVREYLEGELRKLDPDQVQANLDALGFDGIPRWRCDLEGMVVDFFPIPKSPKSRGKSGVRPVGMITPEGGFLDLHGPIRKAVQKKAGRYGKLDLPYVVAVNVLDEFAVAGRDDLVEALFGDEVYIDRVTSPGTPSLGRWTRKRNGIWTCGSGPRYTRLSAVLATFRFYPWMVASPEMDICLIENPWAAYPLNISLGQISIAKAIDGCLCWNSGDSLHEFMGVPPDLLKKDRVES